MLQTKVVDLFIPCFVDQLFPETGKATYQILRHIGFEPRFDSRQTCCGQPAWNSGYAGDAKRLALKFLKLYSDSETVVTPSASCASMVISQYEKLQLTGSERNDLESLKPRLFELSTFLVEVAEVVELGAHFPHKVAYHASCHGLRELGIREHPMTLLENVKGLELVKIPDRDQCCGFGGTFAVKFNHLSAAIGQDKVEAIEQTGADFVTATDDSCLMHISGMGHQNGYKWQTIHYAEILAKGIGK